jgi:hypothetical protein
MGTKSGAGRRGVRHARADRVRAGAVRSIADAQHEAAHVVVGVALGLTVREVVLTGSRTGVQGYAGFDARCGTVEGFALMFAAGVAWERAINGCDGHARGDLAALRRMHVHTPGRVSALVRASWALLRELGPEHARVTRILVERDLTRADVAALMRGERLPAGD